jgi:hypothetical protein
MATGIRAFYVYIALFCYGSRAVNPDSLNPDPAFQFNPDPDTDPDPIWSQGFEDQKLKKKIQQNFFLFIKNGNLLTSKLREKPSALKRQHPSSTSKMKVINFFLCLWGSFLNSWIRIRIANPDTDPETPLNPDMDPDPQHCKDLISSFFIFN